MARAFIVFLLLHRLLVLNARSSRKDKHLCPCFYIH